jgi:hypothetical protein
LGLTRTTQQARSWTAPLLALACLLAGNATVRAADEGAATPDAAPPVTQPRRKAPARDPVAAFAKRLGLDAKQEAQVRKLLALQQAQTRKVWSDPAIAPDDRVGAVKAISAKTIEQIRALLTDEQMQNYIQPLPPGRRPTDPGTSVQDWMHAMTPKNPDAGTPP